MVQFEEDTRAALFGAGVIVLDDNGKTVFTGLTAAETRFILDYEASDPSMDIGMTCHFQQLVAKFHAARQVKMESAEKLTNQRLSQFRIPH